MVDFARNQMGMKVADFGISVSADVDKVDIKVPGRKGSSDKTLEEFIK